MREYGRRTSQALPQEHKGESKAKGNIVKCPSEKIKKCKNNHLQTSNMRSNSSFKGIHDFFLVTFCWFKFPLMINTSF